MIERCNKAMGIDISATSVKAVCVNENGVMDSYGIDDLPANASDTEVILSLKKIISPDCYNCDAVIGLRGLDVLTERVMVENVDNAIEMEKNIEQKLYDLIPVDRNELTISWEAVGQKDGKLDVIAIAVPNKVIERYRRLAEGVGLSIRNLEINGLALGRSFAAELGEQTMIVDVHADETDIEFYQNGILTLDKTVPIGGMAITRAISKKNNISVVEAEVKKRANLIVDEKYFTEIYVPALESIVAEVAKTISMLAVDFGVEVREVLLTGGDFITKQAGDYVIERLLPQVMARVAVPVAVIQSDNIDKSLGDRLRLGNALGLALK